MDRLRAALARRLEDGVQGGAASGVATTAAAAWGAIAGARVPRALAWPSTLPDGREVRVVAVGGATLGGSGKTPLAVACAAALASRGARVALVGHAYRAAPGHPRVVTAGDDVRAVGDEALLAAAALAPFAGRACVVVGPTRQSAVDRALAAAPLLVLDGVAQTSPRRAALALLVLDAAHPWGAARCPPRGDLRAPIESLVAAADAIVTVRDPAATMAPAPLGAEASALPRHEALVASRGAWCGEALVPWAALAGLRVGLVTTVARPSRVAAFLARRGIRPIATRAFADHAPPPARALAGVGDGAAGSVDAWLTTAKCALQLARLGWTSGELRHRPPLLVVDHALELSASLVAALHPTLCDASSDVALGGERARDVHAARFL